MTNNTWQAIGRLFIPLGFSALSTGHVTHWTRVVGTELNKTGSSPSSGIHFWGGEFTFVGGSLNKEEKNFWTRVSRKAICQMSKLGWEKAIGSLREEGGGRKQKSERGEWKSWLKAQHSENEDHGIWSHHFMANRWGNSGNSVRLYFWGPQNHCRWWLQPWN